MSWITSILSGGAGSIVEQIGGVIDNLHTSDEEKSQAKLLMEQVLQRRDTEIEETIRVELTAKERVLVAELQQGDTFTKRARPWTVYAGLAFIGFNYCFVPAMLLLLGKEVATLNLPTQFWVAWGGIVATWSIGRSAERRGVRNRAIGLITGNSSKQAGLL